MCIHGQPGKPALGVEFLKNLLFTLCRSRGKDFFYKKLIKNLTGRWHFLFFYAN